MKTLVFPIIGSLVIGGGAITAPIYAPFIEKAIEDNKEPGPIPTDDVLLNHEWHNSIHDTGYLYSDPLVLSDGDEFSFIASFALWQGGTEYGLFLEFGHLNEKGRPDLSFKSFTLEELYVDGELIPEGRDTWYSDGDYIGIKNKLSEQIFTNKSTVSGTIMADQTIDNHFVCFDNDG